MEHIYVVLQEGEPVNAYRSRMKAFRISKSIVTGYVRKVEIVDKKFARADFEKPVPKKTGRSRKRKNTKK